jgi:small conductance mechanosensitive channel
VAEQLWSTGLALLSRVHIPLFVLIGWWVVDRATVPFVAHLFKLAVARFEARSTSISQRDASVKRLQTLQGLATQIARGAVAVFAVLTLLGSLQIDVRPILTGFGVAGLAISLAAQNIIRDFINGIVVILEDHYSVGDVISVSGYTGSVERFTMRTTHLRTVDGELAIVPNGAVTQVLNFTKNWSRAKIDVGVAYDTDIPRAMKVMRDVAEGLYNDNKLRILEVPDVQGILAFNDSAIVLRCLFKTVPGDQWALGRDYRLRLKEAFDREGIVIPFPQTDVWLHGAGEADPVPKTTP